MAPDNLDEYLKESGGALEVARREGRDPGPRDLFEDIPMEVTNWREEQQAWYDSVTLSDQSQHMNDLFIEGPDVEQFVSDLAVNDFSDLRPGRAKHYLACNHEGYVIGDAVLFCLEEDKVDIVGYSALFWTQFKAETGDYDVTVELEPSARNRDYPPRNYRYQLQGPYALDVMDEVVDGGLPEIDFFHFDELSIQGTPVQVCRHGMTNEPGFEFFGPYEHADEVKDLIMDVGQDYDIRHLGHVSYVTNAIMTAWPTCVPAIYGDGQEMQAYREWLDPDSREGNLQLGGSFKPDDISEYYLTPWEMGYGRFIDWDHEFVGKEALEDMRDDNHRQKVTLMWDDDDVVDVVKGSLFRDEDPYKYMEFPQPRYARIFDKVVKDGEMVGLSQRQIYLYNERKMMSIGMVDPEVSAPGTEVEIIWGEEGSPKPQVEEHVETEIRAIVDTAPFREDKRKTADYAVAED